MVKRAVQSASQSVPTLRRMLVKVGIMWPVHAACVGRSGRARRAEAVEVMDWRVAVQREVVGVKRLALVTGAEGIK